MIFGREKPKEKTVLIVDVESGSVGSALGRISSTAQPRLFGERRIILPVLPSRESGALVRHVERAAGQAIAHASEVASRLRQHKESVDAGTISEVAFFLSPPWGSPNLSEGKPSFYDHLTRLLRGYATAHVGGVPAHFYTHAGALTRGMSSLFDSNGYVLLCSVHGEVVELILLKDGSVAGHGTIPLGSHALIRTLKVHADISEHEARSVLGLERHPYREALHAVAAHFRELFRHTGEPLFGGHPVDRVFVFARGPESKFFAEALGSAELTDLFPEGGTVQVVRTHHLTPFVSGHGENPDAALVLNALFVVR